MPLLNYTTTVAVVKTATQIQGILANHGASAIMLEYERGELVGMSFKVDTPHGNLPFTIPVDIRKVESVLEQQNVKVKPGQAGRVGWRILKDWVEAQMALLETEMVQLEEIFMPYLRISDTKTMYDHMVEKGYSQLALGVGIGEGE